MAQTTPARRPASRVARPGADDGTTETPSRVRTPAEARRRRRLRPAHVALIAVLVVVLALAGAAAGGFAWLRWFSADDVADIQGTWYLAGTSTPITITEDRIRLTDDVSYGYTLDPETKTFELGFGNLAGGGRYRFSLDRDELALVDGRFTGGDTLGADAGWTVRALIEKIQGNELAPEVQAEKGVTLLSRTPSTQVATAASASSSGSAGSTGTTGAEGSGAGTGGSGAGAFDNDVSDGAGAEAEGPDTADASDIAEESDAADASDATDAADASDPAEDR